MTPAGEPTLSCFNSRDTRSDTVHMHRRNYDPLSVISSGGGFFESLGKGIEGMHRMRCRCILFGTSVLCNDWQ